MFCFTVLLYPWFIGCWGGCGGSWHDQANEIQIFQEAVLAGDWTLHDQAVIKSAASAASVEGLWSRNPVGR